MGKYDRILLLGSGKLLLDCMAYVDKSEYCYMGYDVSEKPQKMTAVRAEKLGLHYAYRDYKELFEELKKEEAEILLFIVINPWILPKEILEKENITCINCHQALLPAHKGRNAEAWAIFEGDQKTGITWHRMTERVDEGEILCQKEILITEEMTSLQLFRQQMNAAYEAFTEVLPELLKGRVKWRTQELQTDSLRLSWEIPADGKVDLDWSAEKLGRFLRAMDYGGMEVFKKPTLLWEKEEYVCKKYKIKKQETAFKKDDIYMQDEILFFKKQNYEIELYLSKKE